MISPYDPCQEAVLTIDASVLPELQITYSSKDGQEQIVALDPGAVVSDKRGFGCPHIELSIVNSDHTELNATCFTFDSDLSELKISC